MDTSGVVFEQGRTMRAEGDTPTEVMPPDSYSAEDHGYHP
jgi:hypothetical protein